MFYLSGRNVDIEKVGESTRILEEAGDRRIEKWIIRIDTEKDRRWDKDYDAFNTCVFTGKTFEGLFSPLAR